MNAARHEVVEGRQILIRRGEDLAEPSGQLRLDFDVLSDETAEAAPKRPGWAMPWARVAVGGFVMLALYYLFGYYVAWQNAPLREFYGGTDPGSFFAQMESVATSVPWMIPFQYLRGIVWTLLALLIVRLAGRGYFGDHEGPGERIV